MCLAMTPSSSLCLQGLWRHQYEKSRQQNCHRRAQLGSPGLCQVPLGSIEFLWAAMMTIQLWWSHRIPPRSIGLWQYKCSWLMEQSRNILFAYFYCIVWWMITKIRGHPSKQVSSTIRKGKGNCCFSLRMSHLVLLYPFVTKISIKSDDSTFLKQSCPS